MVCRERGAALLNVVIMLTLLLTLAHILAEKVWQSSRQTASASGRDQAFWAAQAGIEWARHRLAAEYRDSAGWQTCLAEGMVGRYRGTPTWALTSNGLPVELFVRDNPDGDDDPRSDADLKVFVLARARGLQGAEILLESLCGLTPETADSGYPQAGKTTGVSGVTLDPALLPVSTYAIKP